VRVRRTRSGSACPGSCEHLMRGDRVADSNYAVLELRHQVSALPQAGLITRLRLDAALYDPPPKREPGLLGRLRLKGDWRPPLEAMLADEDTTRSQRTIERWYGDAPRGVEAATNSVVWSHSGKPPLLLRWVLRRVPQNARFASSRDKKAPRAILTLEASMRFNSCILREAFQLLPCNPWVTGYASCKSRRPLQKSNEPYVSFIILSSFIICVDQLSRCILPFK
jgi:hypothetical protein